jgi:transposase
MRTKTAPAPNLEDLRKAAESLLEKGSTTEAFEYLLSAVASLLRSHRELELLLAKLEREQVGRRSERIDPNQLRLLFEELVRQNEAQADSEPNDTLPEAAAENQADSDLSQQIEGARKDEVLARAKSGKKRSRTKTRGVRQVHHHLSVLESERHCTGCGKPKRVMGEDVTRSLEYIPAHVVEHVYHKEKLGCGTCKDEVTTAPAPKAILPRSEAGATLLAHLIVSKYADHCPLHRQHRILRRQGLLMPVSTMSDLMAGAANLLQPIVGRLIERKARSHLIALDATGLRVLDPDAAANIVRGTIWCYVLDRKDVLFRYARRGTGASGPWDFLAGHKGYVQADGANVFDRLYGGEVAQAVEVGCWSHGRRRFEAMKDRDCRAAYPLRLITRLFRVEELGDLRRLEPEARLQLRHKWSAPTLESLQRWVQATVPTEPPASELGKAANYLHNQWTALTRILEDGRLPLHNNQVEQQLRDVALGRKNFLFAGSHEAAERAAVLYSLLRTCALRGVPPLSYLADVLRKLADGWSEERMDDLTPDRWLTLYGEEEQATEAQ